MSVNKHSYFLDNSDVNNNDVVDLIASKGYLPNDKYLPKTSLVKSVGKLKKTIFFLATGKLYTLSLL